MFADVGYVCFG
jgi:hypothetical protein